MFVENIGEPGGCFVKPADYYSWREDARKVAGIVKTVKHQYNMRVEFRDIAFEYCTDVHLERVYVQFNIIIAVQVLLKRGILVSFIPGCWDTQPVEIVESLFAVQIHNMPRSGFQQSGMLSEQTDKILLYILCWGGFIHVYVSLIIL